MSTTPDLTAFSTHQVLTRLAPYSGMQNLFKELERRRISPNYSALKMIAPGVFEFTNPNGTSMIPGTRDYYGAMEEHFRRQLLVIAADCEAPAGYTIPDDLDEFDARCAEHLDQLLHPHALN